MLITITLDNATFHVTFHEGDAEFLGSSFWEVNRKQLGDLYKETEFHLDDFNETDEWLEFDDDDDNEERIYGGDANSLVIFLAAASQAKPAAYVLDYHGSAYWFFHDMIHAEYDSGDGSETYIDAGSEERALPVGAELAAKAGISLSEIITELVKATPEFKERFNYEFDAVASFLKRVEIVLK